jgi:hypothetical protein
MFPRGGFDLIDHVMSRGNAALGEAAEELRVAAEGSEGSDETGGRTTVINSSGGGLSDEAAVVIREAIKIRLEHVAPYIKAGIWSRAMAIGAQPENLASTLERIAEIADHVRVAGALACQQLAN